MMLAAFRVRSFRFQWPADLLTSWAFEMETLILSWYVMVNTGSVLWLTAFGSLQYIGTLAAPMFGVLGDRLGSRDPFGDIVIFYYDNRRGLVNDAGRFLLDVYGTYSTDGGVTFAPAFQVKSVSSQSGE